MSSANQLWQETDQNIPNLPTVLVVPNSLVYQVISELHRYLKHGSFDVLPYLGKHATRKLWWSTHWVKARNQEGRRIVVTTPSVSTIQIKSPV
jgi:hypothetical protein